MDRLNGTTLQVRLAAALDARRELMECILVPQQSAALRLFNGYYEGCPDLVVDVYARTLVVFAHDRELEMAKQQAGAAQEVILHRLPWLRCVVTKYRYAGDAALRRGVITYGGEPDQVIHEYDLAYAVDLMMNQDASLYLDTRSLRRWLLDHAAGWSVLNMFAYTGSLGVAALAGGAVRVVQVDRNRKFLHLARQTCILNCLDAGKMALHANDFFSEAARFKRSGELFDGVIVDPPFFSSTEKGRVDIEMEYTRLINKLRPLVKDGGVLVAINNALFLSGTDYMASLEKLCADGYLSVDSLIPVLPDLTGYPETQVSHPPVDPQPFNHPTKIVVLRVKRKREEKVSA